MGVVAGSCAGQAPATRLERANRRGEARRSGEAIAPSVSGRYSPCRPLRRGDDNGKGNRHVWTDGLKGVIEISGERLAANVAAVRKAVGPGCEVLGVIKADAYGHGASLCAPSLARAGLRWLGVGDADEGRKVREALQGAGFGSAGEMGVQLVVMCGFEPPDEFEIVAAHLTPVIWTVEHLQALERAVAQLPAGAKQRVPVHVEIDSGMARQGVVPGASFAELLGRLERSSTVWCEGVFSHLSSSEVAGSAQTRAQCERFAAALGQVGASAVRPRFVHLGNTSAVDGAATLPWVEAQAMGAQAMVRPGLALYGYALPAEVGQLAPDLQPVARWTARVIGLRTIEAGEAVGYGASFVAPRPMLLALLPVGYADGLRREASSGLGDGWVVIAGLRAPVVGRVSMNLTVVDVSRHAAMGLSVALGTEAVLLGDEVSAQDHARWTGTVPYEILCGMRGHRQLAAGPDLAYI